MSKYKLRPSLLIVGEELKLSKKELQQLGSDTQFSIISEGIETVLELLLLKNNSAHFYEHQDALKYKEEYINHLSKLNVYDSSDCILIAYHLSKFEDRAYLDINEGGNCGYLIPHDYRHNIENSLFA